MRISDVIPISEAAGWVNNAIREKARLYTSRFKASMLLAVDIAHMGVLAAPSLRERSSLIASATLPLSSSLGRSGLLAQPRITVFASAEAGGSDRMRPNTAWRPM